MTIERNGEITDRTDEYAKPAGIQYKPDDRNIGAWNDNPYIEEYEKPGIQYKPDDRNIGAWNDNPYIEEYEKPGIQYKPDDRNMGAWNDYNGIFDDSARYIYKSYLYDKPGFSHYGSKENMDNVNFLEAQRQEQIEKDKPALNYLNSLITNCDLVNDEKFDEEFKTATLRSIMSNQVMIKFVDELFNKIGDLTFELKAVPKTDREAIQSLKQNIEELMKIYQKYVYTLKDNNWSFNNMDSIKLPDYINNNLWQIQKNKDVAFKLPIPVDLMYGKKYECEGNMIPTLNSMYDDLLNKKTNWYQDISEDYKKKMLNARKLFEEKRAMEINKNIKEFAMQENRTQGVKHL